LNADSISITYRNYRLVRLTRTEKKMLASNLSDDESDSELDRDTIMCDSGIFRNRVAQTKVKMSVDARQRAL